MEISISLLMGYLLGAFHPAAILAKKKQVDLKKTGTKNLGASNALIVMGRKAGILVVVVDIFKAFLAECGRKVEGRLITCPLIHKVIHSQI